MKPAAWIMGLALASCGCGFYRAQPLDAKALASVLDRPDLARIQVQAGTLRHPLLKAQRVDLANGLSPSNAALLAVVANPDLRAIRDQRALAAAQLLDAGLLPDPVLSWGQDVPVGGSDQSSVTAHSTQLSLDLTSLLTRGLRRKAALAEQRSVDLDVAWQEWQVAEAAKLSAFRILALEPQCALAEEAATIQEELLKRTGSAFGKGAATWNDVASARSTADAGRRAALALRQSLDRERQNLNALLGLPPSESLSLRAEAGARSLEHAPAESDLVPHLEERLDLVALRLGYESQDARVRLAVWSQFPSIGLTLSRARDTSNVVTQGYVLGLSLPLFNRGQGQVAVETATRQQLHDQYLARLYHSRADLAQILADAQAVRGMLRTAREALPALEGQAQSSEAAFRSGGVALPTRYQARLGLLAQRATLAALKGALDELSVALEIASGRSLQFEENR